jgi:hypothetical protein
MEWNGMLSCVLLNTFLATFFVYRASFLSVHQVEAKC